MRRTPRPLRGKARASTYRPFFEQLEDRSVPATLLPNFSETVVAGGLTSATAMEFSPDGKLFITEQAGTMEVWQNGSRLQENFFQANPLITQTASERGLLGIAFDPNYASNRFLYVYYTTTAADNHNRVSRFTANAAGTLAVASSEKIIMELDAHSAGNHNGGAMHFGPDGMLYIATGDNATGSNAQSVANRHGKMLRIDVTGDEFGVAGDGQDYRIPAGQPTTFTVRQTDGTVVNVTPTGVNRSIWAVGLRNPFTFAFQPGTGRMFINDVGQGTWEEINEGGAGRNYGWPTTEGDFTQSSFSYFTRPFYTYDHTGAQPNGAAITGGVFYNPTTAQFPNTYVGDYFFADFGSNQIWSIDLATKAVATNPPFASNAGAPVDLKVDNAGNLYYLARGTNQVFRVSFTSQPPTITDQPDAQTITQGGSVTFTVAASGAAPLTYRWQRAESGTSAWSDIAGATGASYTLSPVQMSDSGDQFRVIVTDTFSRSTTSNVAVLTVTTNQAPTASITITGGLRNGNWDAGTTVNFSGSATDPEQGTLGASSFTWQVDYLTTINGGDADGDGLPGLTRPFLSPTDIGQVTSSSFTPATTGPYTLTDVAHVITLTVRDAQGLQGVRRLVINPNTSTLTVTTSPSGLQVTVDGQPFTAPRTFASVVGFQRPIGAAATQTQNGTTYGFNSWSDGGSATHTIGTPALNTTYTANYTAASGPAPGLKAEFFDYTSSLSVLPDLSARTPNVTRTDATINYASTSSAWSGLDSRFTDTFASRHTGFVRIDTAGSYTFYLNSDDGSKLWLNGELIIDNDGLHSMRERSATRTLTAGYHAIRVEFFENAGSAGLIMSWAGPGISKQVIPAARLFQTAGQPPSSSAFQQDGGADGLVVMEVENNDGNVSQGGKSWSSYTATPGFSGARALQATPNTGVNNNTGYTTNSPRLDFRINFVKTGVHHVWIRGIGPTGDDDSVHIGLDGQALTTADRISSFGTGYSWTKSTMDGVVATINVTSTGIHTLNLWMREDGTIVDKVLLTTNANFVPTGLGPAESARNGAASSLAAPAASDAEAPAAVVEQPASRLSQWRNRLENLSQWAWGLWWAWRRRFM